MKKHCVLCALLCLLLVSCGTKNGGAEQAEPSTSAAFDPYTLPVFEALPEDYAAIHPAFWVAESPNGEKAYLFGSIHLADETAYRLPQAIMDAYLESDALAVEIDVLAYEADAAAQEANRGLTTYPEGDSLAAHIDPLIYEQLVKFLEENAKDPELLPSLEHRKPSIWLSALTEIEGEAAGLSAEFGIDEHFLGMAHAEGKEIIEIETPTSQYEALDRVPDKMYEILFEQYIYAEPEHLGDALLATYAEWKTGELLGTEPADTAPGTSGLSEAEAAVAEYDRVLYTERNLVMAEAIKAALADGKTLFCTVGADHFLGSQGVVALLEAEGYTVSRISGE